MYCECYYNVFKVRSSVFPSLSDKNQLRDEHEKRYDVMRVGDRVVVGVGRSVRRRERGKR